MTIGSVGRKGYIGDRKLACKNLLRNSIKKSYILLLSRLYIEEQIISRATRNSVDRIAE